MKTILVMLCLIFLAALFGGDARAADYRLGVDDVKPVSCDDAATRTDGSALAAAEIDRVEVYITGPGGYQNTVIFPGGCAAAGAQSLDLVGLAAGTYDQAGVTFDTGGRRSALSPTFPFNLLPPLADPNPPTLRQ